MSREHKQRSTTLEDIARELVKGESLEVQLAMSTLVAKARQVANRPIVGKCIEFGGARDARGYGRITFRGSRFLAHRKAWIEQVGEIRKGLHVLHRCDNPPCVNINHLFLGTHADNMRDMMLKGRCGRTGKAMTGEQNGNAKLTELAVLEIRVAASAGTPFEELAATYSVSKATIHGIVNRDTWGHLKDPKAAADGCVIDYSRGWILR
jgi:hypothetical protein